MITIKIKGFPTIGNLQAPWEASIVNRSTWWNYAACVDKMVDHFGHTTLPDNITRAQVQKFRESLSKRGLAAGTISTICTACSSYFTWMQHMGFAVSNPFKRLHSGHSAYDYTNVVVA